MNHEKTANFRNISMNFHENIYREIKTLFTVYVSKKNLNISFKILCLKIVMNFLRNFMVKIKDKKYFSTKFLMELQGTFMEFFRTWNYLNNLSEFLARDFLTYSKYS